MSNLREGVQNPNNCFELLRGVSNYSTVTLICWQKLKIESFGLYLLPGKILQNCGHFQMSVRDDKKHILIWETFLILT